MSDTPHLALPLIAAAQAQKHVTHNEALALLDALTQLSVLDRDRTAPPTAPAEGARHLVAAGATGAFAGQEGRIALFDAGAWRFLVPKAGWHAHVLAEQVLLVFDGTAWRDLGRYVREVERLGIGTAPDATNRLAAKLNNALFAALSAGEGGTGDLRFVLNKEAPARSVSQLYQSGWSGRAEIGLTGDDDLRIKVSPDGSTWREALRVDRASGAVRAASLREKLGAARTYYVNGSTGADGNDGLTSGTAFATIQKAVDTAADLDLGTWDVTIQIAAGTYAAGLVLRSLTGVGKVVLRGDPAAPANVAVAGGSAAAILARDIRGTWELDGLKLGSTSAACLDVDGAGSLVQYRNIDFGSAGAAQLSVQNGGLARQMGAVALSGGGSGHAAVTGGTWLAAGQTITLAASLSFTTAFVRAAGLGLVRAAGMTFAGPGSVTGKRYDVSLNAVIDTGSGGAAYWPGNAAGTTATGGLYA